EGMYMMDKLARLPLARMGLKISPNEIYNSSGTGLSVAVPRLSIGCSSEFVSPDGLILTNHHCGYDALVAASTPEKNYGQDGFRAASRAEEMPAKDYSIDITLREEDVTARILDGIKPDDDAAIKQRVDALEKEEQAKAGADARVQIQPLDNGLFYYLFAYQTIKDIRVVYAPPYSIGQFGGDPDNFEWTRHGGDFTFLRAYVAPDGKAAGYSKDNVPFKPKRFLTISTEGLKENDLTMIIGYPGGTNRYRESASIAYNQDAQLPFTVDLFNARVQALQLAGRASETKRVALQGDIFNYLNSLKAEEGGIVALHRAGLVKQRQADEAKLTAWINQDPERKAKYGDALPNLNAAYAEYSKTARRDLILRSMLQIAPVQLILAAMSGQVPKERLKAAVPEIAQSEPVVNREVFKFLLRKAAELPTDQKIAAVEKRFGNLQGEAREKAEDEFAEKAFDGETVTTEKGLNGLLEMTAEQMKNSPEPLVSFVNEIAPDIAATAAHQQILNTVLNKYRLPFIEAMTAMKGITPYPDANFTERFTYGEVKGYSPREAVIETPFTTLDGVFEKDTGREPFNSPAKLRDLWQRKDYGQYAVNRTVPVDFLTTNDIIGGNSGSPVLNAKGEEVGVAFDSDYEGLGDDFFFSPKLGRTICVDIRYVLFITDKFGGAGWILKEMNINGGDKKAMSAGR
ncbi:MAG: S46 family peptidase, partial [Pyrinomonadaceae bacterium]